MENLESPIILIGSTRSGTTWLGEALSQAEDVAYWVEPRQVWCYGNYFKPDDVLTKEDAIEKIKRHIHQRFDRYVRNRGAERFCEKTPSNCLRIPFIHEIFPDAQFIFLIRDGRAVFRSAREMQTKITNWKTIRRRMTETSLSEFPAFFRAMPALWAKITGQQLLHWGLRPPDWKRWSKQLTTNQFTARQWAESMEIALRDMEAIPQQQKIVLRYEDLAENPVSHAERLVNFLRIKEQQPVVDYIRATAKPSRATAWSHELSTECLQEIRSLMEPTLVKLGYLWDSPC